jgi:LCP family protein required for cell wall assembly
MSTSHVAKMIAGKLLYGAVCLLAAVLLVVSGYAHKVVGLVKDTEKGIAISGSPTVGAMNILVMGLESRTDFEGNTLPNSLLTAMHAGNASAVSAGQVGAQDTDTLILIHIFAGGKKAVGFSIPRDDLVTYPHASYLGITQGKIDQAYDFAYNESLGQTISTKDSSNERYLLANQAGQAFEVATVEAVTGVHIDHFVEANLAGFYYLAQAFGGIEVCVQPWTAGHDQNLSDTASGWNAILDGYNVKKGGDQYLHLSAPQALAYVRDRDSLPQIDLDRTHRQQAVIDYVVWKLKTDNAFSDLAALDSLLGTASKYLVTDSTFNLLDFATNMRALSGSNMTFQTLPIASEVTAMPLNGSDQDVNIINVPYIRQLVNSAFYPPSAGPSSTAATPTPSGASSPSTQGPQSAGTAVVGGQTSSATPTPAATGSPSTTPTSAATTPGANDGQTGGTVSVAPNAPYGVPCVY